VSGELELLERAVGYAVGALHEVEPQFLSRPTPCSRWNLLLLLRHLASSIDALHEGIAAGCVSALPDDISGPPDDLAAAVREAACRLLSASMTADGRDRTLMIGDRPLMARVLLATGALEIATHGWDIVRACGVRRPIPANLAEHLLRIAPLVTADRFPLFAEPIAVPPGFSASDRLVAFLGRVPSDTQVRGSPIAARQHRYLR
jgi:uncharacterized protein (TIGR03086 family)